MKKIFIDGQEGTTGLKIQKQLLARKDLELLEIPAENRKDPSFRKKYLNEADISILCLPDDAARESISLIDNPKSRVIDASTAHRTAPHFAYGLPELSVSHREAIKNARFVANPGCHATGFLISVYPLVNERIIPKEMTVVCNSLTGYSGAGKKMIAVYETPENKANPAFTARPYALSLNHKHLPEMKAHSGLEKAPLFMPVICGFYNGMIVSTLLPKEGLIRNVSVTEVHKLLDEWYKDQPFIKVVPFDASSYLDDKNYMSPVALNGTNQLELFVFGNESQIMIAARFDNLGKGASGAAIQNLNLMCDFKETEGLV